MKNIFIPTALYKKILRLVPILTVDVVIVHRGKFLLVKRLQQPARGAWWTPGGRVLWGEKMEAAVKRKAKDETGISVRVGKLIGIADFTFAKNAWGSPVHTPSAYYLASPLSRAAQITLDKTSADAQWFDRIPKNSHPELSRMLKLAGFK